MASHHYNSSLPEGCLAFRQRYRPCVQQTLRKCILRPNSPERRACPCTKCHHRFAFASLGFHAVQDQSDALLLVGVPGCQANQISFDILMTLRPSKDLQKHVRSWGGVSSSQRGQTKARLVFRAPASRAPAAGVCVSRAHTARPCRLCATGLASLEKGNYVPFIPFHFYSKRTRMVRHGSGQTARADNHTSAGFSHIPESP